jgi:hypothetical protein
MWVSPPTFPRAWMRLFVVAAVALAGAIVLPVQAAYAGGGPASPRVTERVTRPAGGHGKPDRQSPPRSPSQDRGSPAAQLHRDYPWLPQVNPNYRTDRGFRVNCLNCAWATYLNLTGRPAAAMPMPRPRAPRRERLKYFENVRRHIEQRLGRPFQRVTGSTELDVRLRTAGEGTLAIVIGYSYNPGETRHAFNGEFQNGKIRYFEGQNSAESVVDTDVYDDFDVLLIPHHPPHIGPPP